MIPDSFIEELKYACGIEGVIASYVSLKRKGRTMSGLCPFHSEKTPSFTVYPENGSYYCFGCGAGGDVITFVRQVENLEYVEAIKFLAARAGMTVPEDAEGDRAARLKAKVLEINRQTARYFYGCLTGQAGRTAGQGALQYLLDRGLTPKTIKKFGLGFAPEGWNNLRDHLRGLGYSYEEMAAAAVVTKGRNDSYYDMFRGRVMFPIIDLRGNVIGFGGRIMEGQGPKYLNSPDTPVFKKSRNLFALNFAKATQSDTLILGEGYMDVIAIHQVGMDNAVATLGTSLTGEQARLISQYATKVAIAYDSDNAGQNAAKRAINLFGQTNVQVSVLEIPGAKDPDEFIKKFGAQRFQNLVNGGKSAMHYEIDKLKARYDLDDAEGKVAFLSAFCGLMAGVDNELQRDVYIGEVARELEVGREQIFSTVQGMRKKKAYARQKSQAHNLKVYAHDKAGNARSGASGAKGSLSGFVAEEKLITMLLKHPDYYQSFGETITPEDFVDETNRAIFAAMAARMAQGNPAEPIHLSGSLSTPQMARLSQLIATGREIRFLKEQAVEYIRAIKAQQEAKSSDEVKAMTAEEYQQYITSLAANKK